jgi:hypothetical protein
VVRLDFNLLPRISRERFIRALAADPPHVAPICSRREERRGTKGWYILIALSLGAAVAAGAMQFGSTSAPVQDRRFLAVYVVTCACLGLAVASIVRARVLADVLPFQAGVYVLPVDVVDASTKELGIFSLVELVSVEPVHHQRSGVYSHSTLALRFPETTFAFDVRGLAYADGLAMRIDEARESLTKAIQRGRVDDLHGVDPFAEARRRGFQPVDEPGLRAREAPIWARFVWAIALVSGLLPGVGVWRARNAISDERAFAQIASKPDEATANAYLRAGGLRGADVKRVVLPRLQLVAAQKLPSATERATAIEAFAKAHRGTELEAKANAALAAALHAVFLEQTTVPALRSFVSQWPAAADAPAAEVKVHALFLSTHADFTRHQNMTDKNLAPVIDALFAWAEAHPVPIEVRFRRRSIGGLAAADKLLAAGLLDDGAAAKNGNAEASPLFTGGELAIREAALVRGLQQCFRGLFPSDPFALKAGAQLEETKPLPEVTSPTIVVDYDLGWNGVTYVAKGRQRRFLGVFAKLEVFVQVPKDSHVFSFTLKVTPPESFAIEGAEDDARIYDAILVHGYDRTPSQLAPLVFEPRHAAKVAQPL